MLAAFKIRAVPINVNYRYVDDELAYLFDNADLVAPRLRPRVRAAGRRVREPSPRSGTSSWSRTAPTRRLGRARRGAATRTRSPPARRPATSPSAPATTSTCSTPAAPPACRRASCGARRTSSTPSAAASTRTAASRSTTSTASRRRLRRAPAPLVSLSLLAPLMHGAAQWGTLRFAARGQHRGAHRQVRRRRGVALVEREHVDTPQHHRRRHGPPADRVRSTPTPTRSTCRRSSRSPAARPCSRRR